MNGHEQRSDATTAMAPSDWSIERAAQYYNVSGTSSARG
jgi:arginine decarboxylase